MAEAEFVRIRVENGREVSVNRAYVEPLSGVEILDTPATKGGRPLKETLSGGRRAKPKTTVKKAAEAKQAAAGTEPSEPGSSTSGVAADQAEEAQA